MEEMLKSWFPNVKLQEPLAVTQTEEAVPTKKPKVKLFIKKKKEAVLLCKNSLARQSPLSRTYGGDAVKEALKYLLLFNHRSGIRRED